MTGPVIRLIFASSTLSANLNRAIGFRQSWTTPVLSHPYSAAVAHESMKRPTGVREMQKIAMFTFCACLAAMGACGGEGGSSPNAPTTPQSVTVNSSSDLLFLGASETFTATASMPNGGSQSVTTGQWGSDAPSIASVEATSGRVSGVGSGMATIFVDYQGRRGTKLIRVLPNYQGTWSGSYFVRTCSHAGDFARFNFCSNFPENRVLPTNMNLTQDRDRVQGRFFLGTLGGDGSGPVQGNGELRLSGAVQDPAATIEVSWTLNSTGAGRITGSLSFLWRATGLSGDMRVSAEVRDLNRTSSIVSSAAPRSLTGAGTLADLLRALEAR